MRLFRKCRHTHRPDFEVREPMVDRHCHRCDRGSRTRAFGTDEFDELAAACAKVLAGEYVSHVKQIRSTLAVLPRGSKILWKLNRELLNTNNATCLLFHRCALTKFSTTHKTFASKSALPEQHRELELKQLFAVSPPVGHQHFEELGSRQSKWS